MGRAWRKFAALLYKKTQKTDHFVREMTFFCVNGARGENTKKSRRADRRREAKTRMPGEHAPGGKKISD